MYEIGTQVRYHGSIESLHGEIFTVVGYVGDRYHLDGVRGLTNVRHASITPADRADAPTDLARAIAAQHPVMITYVASDGEWTTRTIEPYELAETRDGHMIVRAMDRLRGEPRSFRLDRIVALDALTGSFLLAHPAPERTDRDALARVRADIAHIAHGGYGDDAMRWTPGSPIL